MSGAIRQAFRKFTSLENQLAVRYMSNGAKQLEGGRKGHVSVDTMNYEI